MLIKVYLHRLHLSCYNALYKGIIGIVILLEYDDIALLGLIKQVRDDHFVTFLERGVHRRADNIDEADKKHEYDNAGDERIDDALDPVIYLRPAGHDLLGFLIFIISFFHLHYL